MPEIEPHSSQPADEPPPFLRTWRRVYAGVLIYFAFVVAAAYVFTRAYR